MNAVIAALILSIAIEVGIPPKYAMAIAVTENAALDPLAVNVNANGTYDRGVMQLNSSWHNGDWQDPETNIRAGCLYIKQLKDRGLNYWQIAIAYNAGYSRLVNGKPPDSSIEYANRVLAKWQELEGNKWIR